MFKRYFYLLALRASSIAGHGVSPLWILAQWSHESDDFSSPLAVDCHNFGGLTQLEPNDLPQPDGTCFYMRFDSDIAFADYFGYYLTLFCDDGIFTCLSLDDYVCSLHRGGYFGDDLDSYLAAVKQRYSELFEGGVIDE